MSELFSNVNGQLVPRDVCARKHGSNEQSNEAFKRIIEGLTLSQLIVLNSIKVADSMNLFGGGATLDELCSTLVNKTPNAISGRITELRIMGKIEKRGTRKTRSGCSAAVWVAK